MKVGWRGFVNLDQWTVQRFCSKINKQTKFANGKECSANDRYISKACFCVFYMSVCVCVFSCNCVCVVCVCVCVCEHEREKRKLFIGCWLLVQTTVRRTEVNKAMQCCTQSLTIPTLNEFLKYFFLKRFEKCLKKVCWLRIIELLW